MVSPAVSHYVTGLINVFLPRDCRVFIVEPASPNTRPTAAIGYMEMDVKLVDGLLKLRVRLRRHLSRNSGINMIDIVNNSTFEEEKIL